MKNAILTLCLCVASLGLKAQITLTQDNMPLPSSYSVYPEIMAGSGSIALPKVGPNQTWDYSGLKDSIKGGITVVPNSEPYFTGTYIEDTEAFPITNGSYIYASAVFGQDSKGFFIPGYVINDQFYGLNTGGTYDNITIPPQAVEFNTRQNLITYPATYKSSWANTYTIKYSFLLTVAAFGLSDEYVTKVSHFIEYDSVAGWGNLSLPSPNKASIPYPALMIRQKTVETDSFYVQNGRQPSSILLNYLGLAFNGQVTKNFQERFYGENRLFYLLSMDYGSDASYSNPQTIMYSGHDISSGFLNPVVNQCNFSVYPNPAPVQNAIHYTLNKNSQALWTVTLTNTLGQTVRNNSISGTGNLDNTVDISDLAKGLYMVNITDENGAIRASSKVEIR